jgi:hypothetical protein
MGGNRVSACSGATLGTVMIAAMAYAATAHAAAATPDLSGTYWATEYHAKIQVLGGGEPPLNAAGKTAYQTNQAGLKAGSIPDPARSVCLPDGVPRVLATPYPFELFQAPVGQVTFVHELNHQIRPIQLNAKLPSYDESVLYPTYGGRSSAHYEGDTLVIESNSFNDQTFLDATGLPHSDKLVTTERVRKIGSQLEDVVTIHDPELYTKDWQARFVYAQRDDVRLQEYACGDKHRDISMIKGVNEARAAQGR